MNETTPQTEGKRLLEFIGRECSHCQAMRPIVSRVEKELGLTFESYEVWHDEKNAGMLEDYDRGECGGVPFYYNTATKKSLCGETAYETFRAFAEEE